MLPNVKKHTLRHTELLKMPLFSRKESYHHHSRQLFKKIKEENEKLEKYAAAPVKAIDRIKKSFEIAMADTDNRLMTQSNAKTKRVTAKVVVESVESKAAEQPAAAEAKK